MKPSLKNFIIGFIAGIATVILFLFFIGDVNIETEVEFSQIFKKNNCIYKQT